MTNDGFVNDEQARALFLASKDRSKSALLFSNRVTNQDTSAKIN